MIDVRKHTKKPYRGFSYRNISRNPKSTVTQWLEEVFNIRTSPSLYSLTNLVYTSVTTKKNRLKTFVDSFPRLGPSTVCNTRIATARGLVTSTPATGQKRENARVRYCSVCGLTRRARCP